jgi:HSP20 family protein
MATATRKTARRKTAKKATRSTTKKTAAAGRKTASKKAPRRKATAKRAPGRKAAAPKTPAQSSARDAAIAVKPTGKEPSLEDRIMGPLSDLERLVGHLRQRADQLRSLIPFGPFATSNWEIPSWPDIQQMFDVRVPTMDVVNGEKEIVIRAEVPGVEKDDIVVTVTDRSVTIKGESRSEQKSEAADVHRSEIRAGSFSRTMSLPEEVDGRKAKATYKAGVVELHLPKRRVSKKHDIAID